METYSYVYFHVALGLFTATKMFIQKLNNIWTTTIAQYVNEETQIFKK